MIEPEDIVVDQPGYAPGSWDYRRRCANVDLALAVVREQVEEWDRAADPHGWWHERPVLIALHNEVLQLRTLLRLRARATWPVLTRRAEQLRRRRALRRLGLLALVTFVACLLAITAQPGAWCASTWWWCR